MRLLPFSCLVPLKWYENCCVFCLLLAVLSISICLSAYLSVCLRIYLFVYLSIYLSIYPPICFSRRFRLQNNIRQVKFVPSTQKNNYGNTIPLLLTCLSWQHETGFFHPLLLHNYPTVMSCSLLYWVPCFFSVDDVMSKERFILQLKRKGLVNVAILWALFQSISGFMYSVHRLSHDVKTVSVSKGRS